MGLQTIRLQTVMLLALLFANSGLAVDLYSYDIYDGVLYYTVTGENTVAVTNYIYDGPYVHYPQYHTSTTPDVVIPETIVYQNKEYTVNEIEAAAFYKWSNVASITIPGTITRIGESAFADCQPLQSVTVHTSKVFDNAFANCWTLKTVNLGDEVTAIGKGAFAACSSLQSINFGNSLKTISDEAFKGCSSLQSIVIPNTITDMGNGAFSQCVSLKSVTIHTSKVSDNAFANCRAITTVNLGDEVTAIGKGAFAGCSSLQSINFGNSLKTISDEAFKGCSSLQSIVIPNTITGMGNGVFGQCNGLETVTVHTSKVSDNVFANCEAIKTVNLGDEVTAIGRSAFAACSSLQSINFGNSLKTISDEAFKGCSSLQSIVIPNTITGMGNGVFGQCTGLETVAVHTSKVFDNVFANCGAIKTVNLGDEVTAIGRSAFAACSSLQSINFGNSLKNISEEAFKGCSSLQSIVIPNTVDYIGRSAFYGCTSLSSVVIGQSVTTILDEAFKSCGKLSDVSVLGAVSHCAANAFDETAVYNNQPEGLTYIDRIAYRYNGTLPDGGSIVIKEGTTCIANECFAGQTGLARVAMPASLRAIGTEAFTNCSGLLDVAIGPMVKSIGMNTFGNCTALTGVSIGPSVQTIGRGAFGNCPALRSIEVDGANPHYDSRGRCNAIISSSDNVLLLGCSTTVIPNTVTAIGERAFSQSALTTIVIPGSVTYLGREAFAYCPNMETMTLPNSVATIEERCFAGCPKLWRLQLPGSVKYVGPNTLGVMYSLKSLSCPVNVFNKLKENNALNLDHLSLTGEGDVQLSGNFTTGGRNHQVKTLSIGKGVTGIGPGTIDVKEHIYCYGATPPACAAGTFANYDAVLHVPPAAAAAYFTADVWQNFVNLVNDAVEATSLSLTESEVVMTRGEQHTLTAVVEPDNASRQTISWVSADPSVAIVDENGVVTALAVGETVVTAYNEEFSSTCRIVVGDSKVTLSLGRPRMTIKPGTPVTLDYTVSPATELTLRAESSDETVAAVRMVRSGDKQVIQVLGVADGVATVTVRDTAGKVSSATCRVAVSASGISQGDLDGDGAVDVNDLGLLVNVVLGRTAPDDSVIKGTAHVSGQTTVDIADVNELIQIILGH